MVNFLDKHYRCVCVRLRLPDSAPYIFLSDTTKSKVYQHNECNLHRVFGIVRNSRLRDSGTILKCLKHKHKNPITVLQLKRILNG